MTYISIASALVTILQTVRDAPSSNLAAVFNYDIPAAETSSGYPFACVSNGELREEILDSADNTATYNFIIRVIDLATDKSDTETRMRTLCDAIMTELRKKMNLYLS